MNYRKLENSGLRKDMKEMRQKMEHLESKLYEKALIIKWVQRIQEKCL